MDSDANVIFVTVFGLLAFASVLCCWKVSRQFKRDGECVGRLMTEYEQVFDVERGEGAESDEPS